MVNLHKITSWIWLSLVSAMAVFCWYALVAQGQIKVDILDMLPNSQSDSISSVRRMMDDTKLTQRVVILFGHQDPVQAQQALNSFRQDVSQASLPLTEENIPAIADDYKKLFTTLFSYRSYLLTDSDLHLNADQLINQALVDLTSPFGYVDLARDPYGFFTRYVKSNSPASPFQMDDHGNLLTQDRNGKTWYIYLASLHESAFSMKIQEKIENQLTPILDSVTQKFNVETLKTGALFYAAAGAQQAQNEISLIGSISMLGIVLLMILIFRNFQALGFAITVITVSIIVGLATCLLIFGSIHIISLVIGCSLIGITVDYALHYICATYRDVDSPYDVFKKLVPALPLSALTSAFGFALLVMVPFPGIQQMGVLSATGLLAALITVFLWGPYLMARPPKSVTRAAERFQSSLKGLAQWGGDPQRRKTLVLLIIGVGIIGMVNLRFDDNLKSFQNLNADLKHQEDKINDMLSFEKTTRFLTVKGQTLDDVLQQEESLIPELTNQGVTVKALASLIPSDQRQYKNHQVIAKSYEPASIAQLFKALGYTQSYSISDFMPESSLLRLNLNDLPIGLKELIYQTDSGDYIGRLLITDVEDESKLQQFIEQFNDNPIVHYCDPAHDYSALFTLYRQLVFGLMIGILTVLAGVLSYRVGATGAARILTPLILAIFGTIGLLSFLAPLNFFHAVGLLLSMSIGIDYALFLYWHKPVSTKNDTLLMCNALSALTTVLSFGLLAFSQTMAVCSFGLSVFIGIVLCFILTTIFLGLGGSHDD